VGHKVTQYRWIHVYAGPIGLSIFLAYFHYLTLKFVIFPNPVGLPYWGFLSLFTLHEILFLGGLLSLIRAATDDPGFVERDWMSGRGKDTCCHVDDDEDEGDAARFSGVEDGQAKSIIDHVMPTGELRACSVCRMDQPPRAGHCDTCKRCVYRAEGHSFLVGNCLGLDNIKFYVQYVLLSSFAMALSVLLVAVRGMQLYMQVEADQRCMDLFEYTAYDQEESSEACRVYWLIVVVGTTVGGGMFYQGGMLLLRAAVSVTELELDSGLYHFWTGGQGHVTPLKPSEPLRAIGEAGPRRPWPYTLSSPYENLRQVFGPMPCWIFPFDNPHMEEEADGVHYKTSQYYNMWRTNHPFMML